MKRLRNVSIRRKLTWLVMAVSSSTVFALCAVWILYDGHEMRHVILRDLAVMARVVANGSASTLAAGDASGVTEQLLALEADPRVRSGWIYDREGKLFSSFVRSTSAAGAEPPEHRPPGLVELPGFLRLYSPIEGERGRLGTICIEADLSELRAHRRQVVIVVLSALVCTILLALVFASRMQRVISDPILHLAQLAHRVSQRRDYSARAVVQGRDELGFLTLAFNEMIGQIQARDGDLARHRANLESEVQSRTLELIELNEQLHESMVRAEAAATAKSEFLANMSHEIRTPMNGVIAMTELLLASDLGGDQRSYAEIIRGSAGSLLEIINDVLDFSKIEAGKLRLERIEFELRRTLEEIVDLFAQPARKKGLDLACIVAPDVPDDLRGDPGRLRQVVTNLVSNAVKFTSAGQVVVRVALRETEADRVLLAFAVEDTGIGVPADRMERLFQSFSQIDASMNRRYGGTGLGLAISKRLVRMMNGEIGVESTLGRGSCFWFTVRLDVVEDRSSEGLHLPPTIERPRVVSLDPSDVYRELLEVLMLGWEFPHVACADVPQVLEQLEDPYRREPVDIVVVDESLWGELARELEAVAPPRRPRAAIVLTAIGSTGSDVTPSFPVELRSLPKPIRQSSLFDAIMRALTGCCEPEGAGEPAALGGGTGERRGPAPLVRILLAEDNRVNQIVAERILAAYGYACDTVSNGHEAVDAFARESYDLVLMDCQMPELDGFEACSAIRNLERSRAEKGGTDPPVRIVALTANAMKGDRERCLAAGMDDYLAKPVRPAELIAKVEELAERKGRAASA